MAAYLIKRPNNHWWIQYRDHDGKSHTITLGKVPKRFGETFKGHVGHLLDCQLTRELPRPTTREWLSELPEKYIAKLNKQNLYRDAAVEAGDDELLSFINAYIAERTDLKPNSIKKLEHIRSNLCEKFGSYRKLQEITADDADAFERFLKVDKGYAPATASKRIKQARQLFNVAIKKRRLAVNPFDGIKASSQVNESRKHIVTRKDTAVILEACPDVQWRAIIGLARYGGLRCPSEVLLLKWADIHWDRNRFTVTSPKTEHHTGHGSRVVPLFEELPKSCWNRLS